MSARVFEIDAAPAVVTIDLAGTAQIGIGPVLQIALLDPLEDRVELNFLDQKRIVLHRDLAVVFREIERDVVRRLNAEEVRERHRRTEPHDLRQKVGARMLVARPDDGVVELDGHESCSC